MQDYKWCKTQASTNNRPRRMFSWMSFVAWGQNVAETFAAVRLFFPKVNHLTAFKLHQKTPIM